MSGLPLEGDGGSLLRGSVCSPSHDYAPFLLSFLLHTIPRLFPMGLTNKTYFLQEGVRERQEVAFLDPKESMCCEVV